MSTRPNSGHIFGHVSAPHPITLNSECDFYGASYLIASAVLASRARPPWPRRQPSMKGFWGHGWSYYPCPFIALYRWNDAPLEWPTLVHREDEREALTSAGLENVHAVGAPFLYCPHLGVDRLPRSLLIMPFHSLEHARPRYEEEHYFEALDEVLGSFDTIAACVHPSCLRSGRWIKGFEARGIPYTTGAEASDRNGLLRIKQIMTRFTHVTSNWMGSHIAYAAACGCRVSVHGPRPKFYKEDFVDEPFYKQHPHILDWWIEHENSSYALEKYTFLFVRPAEAKPQIEWALSQLGTECLRRPAEVAELLRVRGTRSTFLGLSHLSAIATKAIDALRRGDRRPRPNRSSRAKM